MTAGQRRWLETLRRDGPTVCPRHGAQPVMQCSSKFWTIAVFRDKRTHEELPAEDVRRRRYADTETVYRITPLGLEALDAIERREQRRVLIPQAADGSLSRSLADLMLMLADLRAGLLAIPGVAKRGAGGRAIDLIDQTMPLLRDLYDRTGEQ
jgi:hypothetical protein